MVTLTGWETPTLRCQEEFSFLLKLLKESIESFQREIWSSAAKSATLLVASGNAQWDLENPGVIFYSRQLVPISAAGLQG